MKLPITIILASAIMFLSGCAGHYSASSHNHGYRHSNHQVSVGVHGNYHGRGSGLLGALVVGGIIGHLLTEAAHDEPQNEGVVESSSNNDELVNGYPITQSEELKEEQKRWYQRGQDGKCYLMESVNNQAEIVSLVPTGMCP